MSGITKWIIGGVLVILALLGIKSLFAPNPAEQAPSAQGWEQPLVMPNANLPSADNIDSSRFTRPLNDKPEEDNTKVELVGEPDAPAEKPTPATPPRTPAATPAPVATKPITPPAAVPEPPAAEVTATPTPAPVAPAPVAVNNTGTLEIMAQTESGKPLKANVYIQQSNGANLDKATYTNKAVFALKPGKYKITVRAEGYASVSRNISVPQGAVVNEIFPLPAIVATAPAAPVPQAPPPQAAPAPAPQNTAQREGKLRIMALSADDGKPIKVNFKVAGLDGAVLDSISNVSRAELTLPAQEIVVSFDLNGFQGHKALTVTPGQISTHTFNIRGVSGQAQAPQEPPPPENIPPAQVQQQPQSPQQTVEELLMQKLQEELQKHLNN
ncbi:PEGA domain-containing protein [Thiothrix fructosivorans]|uniref:PEGA domain-containing protein n=1 Tax=Thiothrix fructosivorans TaxID=111770 RepID=A0A8B0SE90_9GAMM|nr:PEGA domain-containing protein [Thiothrix fructosivorans]MBO0614211.1 PEGA domain-containing protein [Thiothrix fructosivorans]QTX09065.1 PEGA domain-containing protein [Thiothrix fructosivorans]